MPRSDSALSLVAAFALAVGCAAPSRRERETGGPTPPGAADAPTAEKLAAVITALCDVGQAMIKAGKTIDDL